ncbi:MAG: sulfur-carrier protein [Acetobacteraceae bacterium]|jgi:molybdopterin synthase sulfur carrier subunit|nr:sulfur-carrier protein [Acetobacteraceae bacterium]
MPTDELRPYRPPSEAATNIMCKTVTILYFAWLRERTGCAQEEFLLPGAIETVADLIEYLSARDAGHGAAFANCRTVCCAVNQELAHPTSPIRPGDEVAFFPPVTGG